MALDNFRASPLPNPPTQWDSQYMRQLIRVLETYFSQLDSNTPNHAQKYTTDSIQLNTNTAVAPTLGNIAWNPVDQTANIGMDYGVIQQVGEETYARVQNDTGVLIPNGTVVGFGGVGPNQELSVVPYIADGSMPSLYILGVMTHDLPDTGQVGYCTVWGHVRDLDTTGIPAGETWSVGDILYASPTVAGYFTNVKPTAPEIVVPVAAVLKVDATTGEIFVRPTIEQQEYYGVFSDTTTFTPAAAYTPYAVTFNTTDFANGFSRGSPTSRIVAAHAGLYNFQFSLEVSSGSASAKKIWIWPRLNGADIPNSNSEITVSGSGTVLVPSWNWVISMHANDYFELVYAADDTNVQLVAIAAQTGANGTPTFARPGSPSAILTVTQIQQ